MKYRKYFAKVLQHHSPDSFEEMMREVDKTYKMISPDIAFARTSKNPMDKRLDISAYFLALIQVLEKGGATYEQIKTISLQVAHESVRPKNKLQAWLKRLPARLIGTQLAHILVRIMDRKVGAKGHPEGFKAKVITDKRETYGLGYGIDIIDCGICKLYKKHHSQKYASILCEVDHLTSQLAGLQLVRTGTIAHGAEKCDFRFKKTLHKIP